MDGSDDNRILRVGVALAAVGIAVIALRGRLPGEDSAPAAQEPADGVATMVTLVVLGLVAAVILATTLVIALRAQRAKRPTLIVRRSGSARLGRRQILAVIVAVTTILVALGALAAIREPTIPDRPDPEPRRTSENRTPERTDGARPPSDRANPTSEIPTAPILAVAGLLVALAVGGTLVLSARSPRVVVEAPPDRPDDAPHPGTDDDPDALVRAATLGLAAVAAPGRDPRAAIIACYAAMERGLAAEPDVAPLPSDTPSEVLERAVVRGALHAESPGAPLVGLFAEARFSPHQMTEAHRESAVTWLRILLDDLGRRR